MAAWVSKLVPGRALTLVTDGREVGTVAVRKIGASRAEVVLILPPSTTVRQEAAPSTEGSRVRCPSPT